VLTEKAVRGGRDEVGFGHIPAIDATMRLLNSDASLRWHSVRQGYTPLLAIAWPRRLSPVPQRRNNPLKNMAKKTRGGRMTAAKTRAAKSPGGKGPIKSRPAGRKIMKT
jgi:hypothetical protein